MATLQYSNQNATVKLSVVVLMTHSAQVHHHKDAALTVVDKGDHLLHKCCSTEGG